MKRYALDASALLNAYFPDEAGHAQALALLDAYTLGKIELSAPTFLWYEIQHALLKSLRRGRISQAEAEAILAEIGRLEIRLWLPEGDFFHAALRYGCSVYDAIYLECARQQTCPLVTADRSLRRAVAGQELEIMAVTDWQIPDE